MPRLTGLGRTLSGMKFQWRRVVRKEYAAAFDWFSAVALLVLINLWRVDQFDDDQVLTAVMTLVILVRVILWMAARQMNKTPPAARGMSQTG